jgi:hypothetical protein
MKKFLLALLVPFFLNAYGLEGDPDQKFTRCDHIEEGHCMLYVFKGEEGAKHACYLYKYDKETGTYENQSEINGYKEIATMEKMKYIPLTLESNTLYLLQFACCSYALFAGQEGSETICKSKSIVRIETAGLSGEAIMRTNSDSDMYFKKTEFNSWVEAIESADSYKDISVKESLLANKIEILEGNPESPLYLELQATELAPAKKKPEKSKYKAIRIQRLKFLE